MPKLEVKGTGIYYEVHGEGEPLVLVHGSWVNADAWGPVVPDLAECFQVVAYDRRGHSRSERSRAPGSVHEDADDLEALLEALCLEPAHLVTDSFGGNIALRLATRRPELVRSLSCHEPPLFDLLSGDPQSEEFLLGSESSFAAIGEHIESGDHEGAARQFVEQVVFGPGAWDDMLPGEIRETFIENAPTFLDELEDPDQLGADHEELALLDVPARFTQGSESQTAFARVVDRLVATIPGSRQATIYGAAHVPQLTVPRPYAQSIAAFARSAGSERTCR